MPAEICIMKAIEADLDARLKEWYEGFDVVEDRQAFEKRMKDETNMFEARWREAQCLYYMWLMLVVLRIED